MFGVDVLHAIIAHYGSNPRVDTAWRAAGSAVEALVELHRVECRAVDADSDDGCHVRQYIIGAIRSLTTPTVNGYGVGTCAGDPPIHTYTHTHAVHAHTQAHCLPPPVDSADAHLCTSA